MKGENFNFINELGSSNITKTKIKVPIDFDSINWEYETMSNFMKIPEIKKKVKQSKKKVIGIKTINNSKSLF